MKFKDVQVDDRVLCKDSTTGIYYDSKVVGKERGELLIHYQGWNKRFDEWIDQYDVEDRLLPFSQEILEENKKLLKNKKREVTQSVSTAAASVKKQSSGSTPTLQTIHFPKKTDWPAKVKEERNRKGISRKRKFSDNPNSQLTSNRAPSTETPSRFPVSSLLNINSTYSSALIHPHQRWSKVSAVDLHLPCNCGHQGCELLLPIRERIAFRPPSPNSNILLFHCRECGSAFEYDTQLISHQKEHEKNAGSTICDVPPSKTAAPSIHFGTRNVVKLSNAEPSSSSAVATTVPISLSYCSACKLTFTNKALLESHIQLKHSTQCAICHKVVLMTEIHAHLQSHSVVRLPSANPPRLSDYAPKTISRTAERISYKCCICGQLCPSKNERVAHVYSSHPNCSFKCKRCTLLMRSHKEYIDHDSVCSRLSHVP